MISLTTQIWGKDFPGFMSLTWFQGNPLFLSFIYVYTLAVAEGGFGIEGR